MIICSCVVGELSFKTWCLQYPQCNLATEWHHWRQFIRWDAASSSTFYSHFLLKFVISVPVSWPIFSLHCAEINDSRKLNYEVFVNMKVCFTTCWAAVCSLLSSDLLWKNFPCLRFILNSHNSLLNLFQAFSPPVERSCCRAGVSLSSDSVFVSCVWAFFFLFAVK